MSDIITCKQYDSLDVLKCLLALMVVAIHAGLYPAVLYPWLRLAVPTFFLMSSYFFFSGSRDIVKFLRRLAKLYFSWFMVLLPVTLYIKWDLWLVDWGWIVFIKDLLLGSTFPASWFFSALALSMVIVFYLNRFLRANLIVLISLIPYVFVCLCSSYPEAFEISMLMHIRKIYVVANPVYSFFAAMLWVSLGLFLAEKDSASMSGHGKALVSSRVPGHTSMYSVLILVVLLLVGGLSLYLEWSWIYGRGNGMCNDWYLMLPLAVVPLFVLTKNVKVHFRYAKELRYFSVITFPLHFAVIKCIRGGLKMTRINDVNGVCVFAVCIFIVIAVCALIRVIERYSAKYTRWLH